MSTITISDLKALDDSLAKQSMEVRRIRMAAERGDISPEQAEELLESIHIMIRK
jgi:hypothetical protein